MSTGKTILTAAALLLGTVGISAASSLSGTSVTITSSFDGHASQNQTVTVGANEAPGGSIEVGGSSFDWMSANDYIDIYENPADTNRKIIKVFFDENDTFAVTDDIRLTFQLAPGWTVTNSALGDFISVTAPDGMTVNGGTISIDLQGLDQIGGTGQNDAHASMVLFLDGPVASTPEPGTIGLALAGAAALFLRRRR